LLRALDAAPERAGAPNQPRRSGAAALRQVIERQRRRDRVSDWFAVACLALACACADPASLESPDGDTAISTDAASSDAAGAATQVMVQPSCVVGTATSGSGRKLTPTGASLATGVAQSPSGRTLSPAPGPLR
jgi:hypothetical protein